MTANHFLSLEFVKNAIQNPLRNEKCCDLHAGSCLERSANHFALGAKSFAKLYFVFLFGHFLIARRKKIVSQPIQEFKKFFKGFIKSLIFSGGYLGICRAVICFVTKFYANGQLAAILSANLGGTSLILEPAQRQPEIALFLLTNSLETMWKMGKRRDMVKDIPNGMAVIYVLSLAVVCYHYFNNRENVRRSYTQILDKLLGDS